MAKKLGIILSLCFVLVLLTYFESFAQDKPRIPMPPPKPYNPSSQTNLVELGRFPVDTSPHGLKLLGGSVLGVSPLRSGYTVTVRFSLQNVSGRDIKLDSNGIFVGARWNSTTDANNRDFGHQYRNYTLRNNEIIKFEAKLTLDRSGTWRFWPAYHIGGGYGPFRWHEIVLNVP